MVSSFFLAVSSLYIKSIALFIFLVSAFLILCLKKEKALFLILFSALVFFRLYFIITDSSKNSIKLNYYFNNYNIKFLEGEVYKDSKLTKSKKILHFIKVDKVMTDKNLVINIKAVDFRILAKNTSSFFKDRILVNLKNYYFKEDYFFAIANNVKLKTRGSLFFEFRISIINYLEGSLKSVPYRVKGLSTALLLGRKTYIDDEFYSSFYKANLNHFLAISGFHVGFLLACSFFILKYLRNYKIINIINYILLLFYVFLLGFIPSLIRTSIFFLFYFLFNNKAIPKRRIFFFSLLTNAFLFPESIFELSFIYSYTSFFGIIFFYPYLVELIKFKILKPFLFSFASSFFVYFIIYLNKGFISFGSLFFNSIIAIFILLYLVFSILLFIFHYDFIIFILNTFYKVLFFIATFISNNFSFLADTSVFIKVFITIFVLGFALFLAARTRK